jgi:CRP-like cAMP-binding protein
MLSPFGPDHRRPLGDIDLFAACTPRELRRIETLGTIGHVKAGCVVFRRGEIGRECFVVLDGQVDVDVAGRHCTGTRGTLVGEIALLTLGARRTATVVALTDLTVLVLTRAEFSQLMSEFPVVAHKVLRETTRRLIEDGDPRTIAGRSEVISW